MCCSEKKRYWEASRRCNTLLETKGDAVPDFRRWFIWETRKRFTIKPRQSLNTSHWKHYKYYQQVKTEKTANQKYWFTNLSALVYCQFREYKENEFRNWGWNHNTVALTILQSQSLFDCQLCARLNVAKSHAKIKYQFWSVDQTALIISKVDKLMWCLPKGHNDTSCFSIELLSNEQKMRYLFICRHPQ